ELRARQGGPGVAGGVVSAGSDGAADADGVGAVTVPVAHVDLITGVAEGHHRVGVPAAQGVVDVEGAVTLDGEAVTAIAVPVTSQHHVIAPAVGKRHVGRATTERVAHVVHLPA